MAERYIPKWAEAELEELKRENVRLKRENQRLSEALAGDGAGLFSINKGATTEDLVLPSDVHSLRVKLRDRFEITLMPEERTKGKPGTLIYDTLQVMVTSHHALAMYPQSGNVVHLGPGRN